MDKVNGSAGNFEITLRKKARYIDTSKCTGCSDCIERCPIKVDSEFDIGLIKRTAIHRRYPQAVPGAFTIDKKGISPCRSACRAGVNSYAYIALLKAGKLKEAYEVIKKVMPFSGICGRVCHHPCETECYRGKLLDEPVAICSLKRYIADRFNLTEVTKGIEKERVPKPSRTEKVGIIGAGPAGLTCARDLAARGYNVTIFESRHYAGEMIRRAIPRYRLSPKLVEKEVSEVLTDNNIKLRLNTTVGKDISFADLRKQFDALFVAVGAQHSRTLPNLPGIELNGVMLALPFLEEVNNGGKPIVGERVVVIGGGNVAMDVARTALRLGAKEVNVVCLESWDKMLCHPWEREEALEEGVKINNSLGPKRLIGKNNKVMKAEFLKVKSIFDAEGRFNPTYFPGTERIFDCDTVIIAIGQSCDLGFLDGALELNPAGTIKVDPITLETSASGVFAGGDVVKGPASIVEAVGAGHEAAISIDRYLNGKDLKEGRRPQVTISPEPKTEGLPKKRRVATKRLPPEIRKNNFDEVVLPLSEEEAITEAQRCLDCAICCECFLCVEACEAKAINHEMEKEELVTINVGAIIIAPGFELFDPHLKPDLGFGLYPNVISSLQFERLLSPTGPTGGKIQRPSDSKPPKSIAFIQCVGSRDFERDYCSAVCCMYATKEAILAKEYLGEELRCDIFYMDLRAFSKGFEEYYNRAKSLKINYIRCRPPVIKEVPETRNLIIEYLTEDGRKQTKEYEMVILSVGLAAPKYAKEIAEKFGLELNKYGFCSTNLFTPVSTPGEGVFVAGVFTGPKDIPESVIQGCAASAQVLSFLASEKGKLVKEKVYPPERDVRSEEPRVGVFVCHCGKNIAGVISSAEVAEYTRTLPNVVYADHFLYACSTDAGEKIKQAIKEHNLNRVVVASCTPRTHELLFQSVIQEAGLNPYLFEMANIRDQCTWVHTYEPEAALRKAKDLVRMAVAKARLLEPLYRKKVKINRNALVIGGGISGLTAALGLADQGFETYLIEQSETLGGNFKQVKFLLNGENPQQRLDQLIKQAQHHSKIHIYTNSQITNIEGSIGNFTTEFKHNGTIHSIKHGVVIVATGACEYKPTEYLYGDDKRVITQLELEEKLVNGEFRNTKYEIRNVVMIQCIGSRDEKHPYCSRICCQEAIKNALKIKEVSPNTHVYLLYRDMRTYGFNEAYYTQAREKGVRFVIYDVNKRPTVKQIDGHLKVSVYDPVIDADINIKADLVVLSTGVVPRDDAKELTQKLKIPLTADGFFLEAHMKLRPVDFASDGVFLCGLAHFPKTVDESIAQALAATSRASTILSKEEIEIEAIISQVIDENCDGCAYCVNPCPFKAITLIEYIKDGAIKKTVEVDELKCKGCGTCQATCSKQGIIVRNFRLDQISAMIEAALIGG